MKALRAAWIYAVAASAWTAPAATAQAQVSTTEAVEARVSTPIQELITEAREALDGLRYAAATEIAHTLLDTADEGYLEIEVIALQILAAAAYPEEEAMRRPAQATAYVERLIWTGPDATIPRSMSWPGLDSLLEHTRRETFVVYSDVQPHYLLQGMASQFAVPVRTSRPALVRLVAVPPSPGRPVVLDSLSVPTTGLLNARMFADDRPRVPSGEYELHVVAVDGTTGESVLRRYPMAVDAPPLALTPQVAPLSLDALLPEREEPRLWRNAMVALGVGAATVLSATALRGDPIDGSHVDRRSYAIGVSLSFATLVGTLLDRGKPLPDNVSSNAFALEANRARSEEIARENRRLRAEYVGTVDVGKEIR